MLASWTDDEWMRRSVLITFLWLLVMLIAGILLIQYSSAFQGVFG